MTKWFMLSCGFKYGENPSCGLGQKVILEGLASQKFFLSEHLNAPSARYLSAKTCTHILSTHTHTHTHLITALISQADSPDRQTNSPSAPDEENLLIACSFLWKLPRRSANVPPLLLTHTNIILHNSADPDPTVHISLLVKGLCACHYTHVNHSQF